MALHFEHNIFKTRGPPLSGREKIGTGCPRNTRFWLDGLPERRYAWFELIRRVYSADSLKCERCGGKLRIIGAINPPEAIRKILDCLGIPSRPPPLAPATLERSTEEHIN
jgi:hypothetical protein